MKCIRFNQVPRGSIIALLLFSLYMLPLSKIMKKSEHITHILKSLHWLPVTFRIDFKVRLLVYKSLNWGTQTQLLKKVQTFTDAPEGNTMH